MRSKEDSHNWECTQPLECLATVMLYAEKCKKIKNHHMIPFFQEELTVLIGIISIVKTLLNFFWKKGLDQCKTVARQSVC